VGLPIELSEFDESQVHDLQRRHGLDFSPTQVEQLMAMVGGHPHLVRLAFYKIACNDTTLEQILQDAPLVTGIYADHLRLLLWHVEQYPELVQALKQVVESDSPVELKSALAFKLNSMGLVHLQGDRVTIRNNLYRQYFLARLRGDSPQYHGSPSSVLDTKAPAPSGLSWSEPAEEPDLGDNMLAAIVFTDVKDATEKQHKNQKTTLAAIHRDHQLMTQLCQQFEGRVGKSLGDGLLMYFGSAVQAVNCALAIQKALAVPTPQLAHHNGRVETLDETVLQHRIGIHLADVYLNGTDVIGDGVNIAFRIQSEAKPGGICISWIVYESVKTHLQLKVTRIEQRNLKGIADPMLLYQVAP
jgi:class 3 adenylate cyclase